MDPDEAFLQIDEIAQDLLRALKVEQRNPGMCFVALASVMGLVVGSSTIDEERACNDVQKVIRITAAATRRGLSAMSAIGSSSILGTPGSGSNKIH